MIRKNKDENQAPKAGIWVAVAVFMIAVASVIGFNQGGASAADHGDGHSETHSDAGHGDDAPAEVHDDDSHAESGH